LKLRKSKTFLLNQKHHPAVSTDVNAYKFQFNIRKTISMYVCIPQLDYYLLKVFEEDGEKRGA